MGRNTAKTEYGYDDMSIDDILSQFGINEDFSDPAENYTDAEIAQTKRRDDDSLFDSRFNIGGKAKDDAPKDYGGLDVSADEDYVPPQSEERARKKRAKREEADSIEADYPEKPAKKKKKKKNGKKKKGPSYQPGYESNEIDDAEFASKFRNISDDRDDGFDSEVTASEEKAQGYFPPSFTEYLASLFAAVHFKLRGFNRSDVAATMNDDDEDLGAEVNVRNASKYYGSFVQSARLRFLISLGLLTIMFYISLGLPLPGMLKSLPVNAAMSLAAQFAIMLLGLDVVTNSILKIVRLRPGADSLAVISCILTSVDAALVASSNTGISHPPLCALSSLSLIGVMLSTYLTVRSFRKAMRVPSIAKRTYAVVGKNDLAGKEITLLKTSGTSAGFVRRCEEAAPDETMFEKLSPFILLIALLMALVVSVITNNASDFVYIFSAILCPGVPFCALLCFILPFFLGTMKMFTSGTAIAGWSGLCDVGQSNNLIVTDRDIFPSSSVKIESIRIFADEDAQKVISYAGSLILASGCSMSKAFADEMEQNNCPTLKIDGFEALSGGGFKGLIEGSTVLCGSAELMRLMNIKIPFRLVDKTTVLLAIDGVLFGIFSLKYEPNPQVRKALIELMRSNRHPIFAVRDFNITPDMLKELFDIATDGYDFPPYVERFKITEARADDKSQIAAVVCREGLAPLTTMAETGHGMYMATRVNLVITVVGAVLGMVLVLIKMLTSAISLGFIFLIMLITALPVFFISLFMK